MNLSDSAFNEKAAPHPQVTAAPRTHFASSPIQLRAAAHLYGIESVPLARARVLELGCGTGDNLFPFALAWPSAQVVGIDANPDDVHAARAAAAALGAGNAQFHVMGEVDLGADLGQFDYIILHQTYGKVPDELGNALLALCKQLLSPLGLAFVSYHTLPGWKGNEALRDAMQFAGHSATGLADSVAEARTMLTMLGECMTNDGRMVGSLAPMIEYARGLSDDQIAAEFLQEPAPSATYFIEFANTVVQHGLAHIGDAEPQQEIAQTFGTKVAMFSSLKGLGQTAAVRQQYLDFAINRRFRQSVLVHQDRAQQALASPDMARLGELRFAGMFRQHRAGANTPASVRKYSNQQGRSLTSEDTRVFAVIAALTAAWPVSCSLDDLIAAMPDSVWESEEVLRKAVRSALEVMLRAGVLRMSLDATSYDAASEPRASLLPQLRRLLEAHGEGGTIHTWSLWHEPVKIELSAEEVRFLLANEPVAPMSLSIPGVADETANGAKAARDIPQMLEHLRENGLLTACVGGWVGYHRALLSSRTWKDTLWWQRLEAMHSQAMRNAPASPVAMAPPVRDGLAQVHSLWQASRQDEALKLLRTILQRHPEAPEAWRSLARALNAVGKTEDALTAMGRAVERKPLDAGYQGEFADMLAKHQRPLFAEGCARRSAQLDPRDAAKFNRLALIYRTCRKFQASVRCLEISRNLDPSVEHTHNLLGIVYSEGGDPDMAEASYRRSLELNPGLHAVHSNLLFLQTHRSIYTPQALFAEHRRFGEIATERARGKVLTGHANVRDPARPLRIGFVSGDLRRHAVMNFLEPIWENLDREQFQIYAYHTGESDDATSERVKPLTRAWRMVRSLNETGLRDCIAADGIDILFDLSGHTDGSRLTTFAMRPAPVQISWIGYPGTTGLAEMDYFITDRHAALPGVLDDQFTEKLVYLPSSFTFQPSAESPPVSALPAGKKGHVTFGSFNRYLKISDDVLALWARVLTRVPDSKMLLGNMSPDTAPKIIERFAKFGIPANRIEVRSNAPMKTYLGLHQEIDMILDTFPYTGGTTTCHGLWMGVPILTLIGDTRVARQTSGVLYQLGLEDWASESADALVEKAAQWAGDLPALAALRAGMRARIEASSMLRPADVARGLEKAMRRMWATWCAGQPVSSFTIDP